LFYSLSLKGSRPINRFIELLVELSNKRQCTFYHEMRRHVKAINKKIVGILKIGRATKPDTNQQAIEN
jgi:hypothetical protein